MVMERRVGRRRGRDVVYGMVVFFVLLRLSCEEAFSKAGHLASSVLVALGRIREQ